MVSLWRNRWLSLASTLVMIITLIIISLFVSLTIVTNKVTTAIKNKIDMAAYMEDAATDDQVFALRKVLLSRSDVVDVYYVSKKEALRDWQERNKDNADLRDIITEEENPLPRSLEVKTKTPEDLDSIAKLLSSQDYSPLVKELSYTKSRDMINRLVRFANFIKISGWTLTIIFVLISILVIYNTIRLTIFARSEEIEIMKLVGATDWFVRGPFIFEGIAYGVAATAISSLLLYGGGYLGVSFALVVVLELAVGVLLGMLCSVLAVKKYLKQI